MIINRFSKGYNLSSYDENNLPSASFYFQGTKLTITAWSQKIIIKRKFVVTLKQGLKNLRIILIATLTTQHFRVNTSGYLANKNGRKKFQKMFLKSIS